MLASAAAAASLLPVRAADWPQFRGPARNGISTETGWLSRWPASGPKRVWSARVGNGFSSTAVAGGRLYTVGNASGKDTVYCLDANTGKKAWTYSYPCKAGNYEGPRATPTVSGGRVYVMSREGGVACLDAVTGKGVWGNDLARRLRAEAPQWGFAGSPLVEGNRVIFNIGSAGAALDAANGKVAWQSGGGAAGYASPVAFDAGGQRGVAIFGASRLIAVNPANGRKLWEHPWDTSHGVNAADPIFSGDTVFISSNYDKGCALLRIAGGRPSVVWQNRSMRNHFNSSVLVGGFLFGNDQNTLRCIDQRTGAERWGLRGLGTGGLIAADGKLIALSERGELFLAQATPDRYVELARAKVLSGDGWVQPVLANGKIYCRSRRGELVCVDVKGR